MTKDLLEKRIDLLLRGKREDHALQVRLREAVAFFRLVMAAEAAGLDMVLVAPGGREEKVIDMLRGKETKTD